MHNIFKNNKIVALDYSNQPSAPKMDSTLDVNSYFQQIIFFMVS